MHSRGRQRTRIDSFSSSACREITLTPNPNANPNPKPKPNPKPNPNANPNPNLEFLKYALSACICSAMLRPGTRDEPQPQP